MSIYDKRKKRKYDDKGASEREGFADRHREAIIFILILIIVGGGVAAVNAYELRQNSKLISGANKTSDVSYYASESERAADGSTNADMAGTASGGAGAGADNAGNDVGAEANTAGVGTTAAEAGDYPDLSQSDVTWKGKHYKRNTYIKPILLLGVDNAGSMHAAKEYGEAGQCDGVFLIAQDTAHNKVKLLMIPRDTMTDVLELNPVTGVIEPFIDHLSLSYCFGDGMEASCENSRTAVQTLLMNFQIDSYMAIDTSAIAGINDAVGGVTVTIPTEGMTSSDSAFIYGETITLHGQQAERFVRYRDTKVDNSAISRMSQHRQYISGFYKAIREKSKTDSNIVNELYNTVQDYMITNMPKETYLKTALDVLQQGEFDDSSMLSLPGYGTTTDTFDEYYADKNSLVDIMLSMFYREV